MSVASLLNSFKDAKSMGEWSFSNNDSHVSIINTLSRTKSVHLTAYVLDPVAGDTLDSWLLLHQAAHNDFNTALNLPGNDLSYVDINDKDQLESWLQLHFEEHVQAHIKLGI
jgi:hypothetical protein